MFLVDVTAHQNGVSNDLRSKEKVITEIHNEEAFKFKHRIWKPDKTA